MFRTIATSLVALIVLGSVARAESGTDIFLDTSRTGAPYEQTLTTKPVAMSKANVKSNAWMDHASQVVDGGY